MTEDILRQLADYARIRTAEEKKKVSPDEMKARAFSMNTDTGFPFEKALSGQDIGFICECKKASPSRGLIAPDFPYVRIAQEYEAAGASCISVLTEPKWFLGSNEYLRQIAQKVHIPCIRKDFTVDEYMIYEAKALGASAILLICALLDTENDENEIRSAVSAGARIIGVNNRNLRNFTVDVHNSEHLRALVPENILFVAESGIQTAKDVEVLRQAHVNGVLIGETLMRAPDKKAMLDQLRGKGKAEADS